jgi:hypothetical protein
MASENYLPDYNLYDIIVQNFERLLKDLGEKNFQEVKDNARILAERIESNPAYSQLNPLTHEILHFVKKANNLQELRRSLGAGIGEARKIKTIILRNEVNRLSGKKGRLLPKSKPSEVETPNFRINIADTPVQTPNVRINVHSERPTPERIPEGSEEIEKKHSEIEPIPIPGTPQRFLQATQEVMQVAGEDILRQELPRLRNRRIGERISLQNFIGYGGKALAGFALTFGAGAVYSLYDYLTSHPEIQDKVEKQINEHQASLKAGESIGMNSASLTSFENPYEHRPSIPRGFPRNYRPSPLKRYTGNYKFPLGAYDYVEFDKFTRNNTIRSLT